MRKIGLLIATTMCVIVMSMTAFAGEWGSQDGRWYYKGDNGKYYTNGKKNIDGKTYAFDYEGWMITGYTDENLSQISGTDCNAAFAATYYFDTDGAMYKGWLKVDKAGAPSEYDAYNELWFYFDSNGKKVKNENGGDFKITNIDSEKYAFDSNGVMVQGWGTSSTDKTVYVEEGKMATGWKQLVPPDWMDSDDNAAETKRWFYFKPDGVAVKNCCKRIGSVNYLFDENGILKTGMYFVTEGASLPELEYKNFHSLGSSTEANWSDIIDHEKGAGYTKSPKTLYYFTVNGMQKGSKSIDIEGTKRTMNFGNNGKAISGIKSGKLYVNGGLVTSGDEKYAAAKDVEDGSHLVNKNGSCTGKGRVVSDSGYLWAVDQDGYIGYFDETDKTAANEWAKGSNGADQTGLSYVN